MTVGFMWFMVGINVLLFTIFPNWGNLTLAVVVLLAITARIAVRR